jgi:tetratricopeptide (TPR) repeat protein
MLALIFVCSFLIVADDRGSSTATPADLAVYDSARAKAGHDADAHVRLAVWCESHDLSAERMKHLSLAVLYQPTHALARGLMGLVAYRGRWQRPDAVAQEVKTDEATAAALAEYNARRAKAPNNADAQWKLALWCEERGLKAEATAHLAAVVRLDPSREAAWKRMGYRRYDGRWMTDAEASAEKAEEGRQHLANRIWKSKLEKWRGWLDEKGPRRNLAETRLAEVTDPRAAPAAWVVFALGDAGQQVVAVQLFGQIDSPPASHALVMLATLGASPEVRRKAA